MAGEQLKALFKSFKFRDEHGFRNAAEAIIAEEIAKKHTALAADLQRIIGRAGETVRVAEIPVDRESRLPLVTVQDPTRTLAQVVLGQNTRKTIYRIAAEVKLWPELDAAGLPRRNRVLLTGPPGCGKTSTVAALANELGRPLVTARVESLISSLLGATGENIAKLFDYAATGEYVILLDEFDAIGHERGNPQDTGEMRRVTNAILTAIENYAGGSLIIAATNHPDALDSALWRRFDFVADLPLPGRREIRELLESLMGKSLVDNSLIESLVGLPHASTEYLAHCAVRNAVFAGRTEPTANDLAEAVTETLNRRWN